MLYAFTIPPSDTPIEIRADDRVKHMDSTEHEVRGFGTVVSITDHGDINVKWERWSQPTLIDRAFLCRVQAPGEAS